MRDEVSFLLNAHLPQDEREEKALRTLWAIQHQTANPFDRNSFRPGHFTASAFCLSPDSQSLLLIYHPVFMKWIQPGGHFKPNDSSPLAAALRELREETGIRDVEYLNHMDLDIHDVPAVNDQESHLHGDLRFWLRAASTRLSSVENGHPSTWIPLAELDASKTDQSVLLAVQRWLRFNR